MITRLVVDGLMALGRYVPKNSHLWTYTIATGDSPYISRMLFPRVRDWRPMLHNIHRPDIDPDCHGHPWEEMISVILSGGYVEERVVDDQGDRIITEERTYQPGDINRLTALDFHRILRVKPGTRTLFLVGKRVQGWGFLVAPQRVVAHEVYSRSVQPGVGA